MSISALNLPLTPKSAIPASFSSDEDSNDVVEISLLLPKDWAAELIELSKKRQQSVGLILRSMIKHSLIGNDTTI